MRTRTRHIPVFLILALLFVVPGCENDDNLSAPKINGLSLYWDHEIFGDEGRRLRFVGSTTNEFNNDYELEFNTSIVDKSITVRLDKSVDNGKCQDYPMPVTGDDDPNKCIASGDFYLPDKELGNGVYSLKFVMPSFEITSELTVTDEKVMLDIPANKFVKSSIKNVYPIPPDLLFGSIVYQGSGNTNDAENFLNHLSDLGLSQTTVPNYPYRHLLVDEDGHPPVRHWDPDRHSIGFLYSMNNTDFKTVIEESKEYFNQTNLNIYLYTSNGDQGLMNKLDGITVVYAK